MVRRQLIEGENDVGPDSKQGLAMNGGLELALYSN
jgi:hypothetical protein